jgi:hypothetical protein
MECHYELAAYGIPRDILPVDDDGKYLITGFRETMEERKKKQLEHNEATELNGRIENPTEQDVLLGRGRPFQVFPGNLRLARITDELLSRYQAMRVGEKGVVADEVIRRIRDTGGRFLKRADDGETWVEVIDAVSRDKTSQGFQTLIKRKRALFTPS